MVQGGGVCSVVTLLGMPVHVQHEHVERQAVQLVLHHDVLDVDGVEVKPTGPPDAVCCTQKGSRHDDNLHDHA